MPRLKYLEGVMPTGHTGICGDPNRCAIANQLRTVHGVKRPKVGLSTISFVIDDVRYTVSTLVELREFQHEFDKYHRDGQTETLLAPQPYRIPLSGKSVTTVPVEKMTEEAKARMKAGRRRTRAEKDRANEHSNRYKAKLRARVT